MNSTNRHALWLFTSQENCQFLWGVLASYWNDPRSTAALRRNLPDWMMNYAERQRRALMYTEAKHDPDVQRELNALNDLFIAETIKFVEENVLYARERASLLNDDVYNWNDGRVAKAQSVISKLAQQVVQDRDSNTVIQRRERPRSTHVAGESESTMAVLDSWRYPARGRMIRDDVPGDTDRDDACVDPKLDSTTVANVVTGDGFYFQGVEPDTFGVQRRNEMSDNAVNMMMNDPKVQLLNRHDRKYGNGRDSRAPDAMPQSDVRLWSTPWAPVDESDPTQLDRFMNRRIMRSQNMGCDGRIRTDDSADAQIPWYRRAIQHRQVDMNTKTSLDGNIERGCHQRGFDMSSLLCRVEDNRRVNQAAGVAPFRFEC